MSDLPTGNDSTDASSPQPSNLTNRVVFGAILAAVAFSLLWAGTITFALLVLAISLIMSWEWGRVVRDSDYDLTLLVHGFAVAAAIALASLGFAALGAAVLLIGAIIVFLLQFGDRPVLSALGVLYTGGAAVSLVWLRSQEPMGFYAVLFLFAVVWTTDILAYVGGRWIGGPKFAPAISPNKTWAGFICGVSAAAGAGAVLALWIEAPVGLLAASATVLAAIAQLGDLAESALKRLFGVKDSSHLIPGHGGFLDRMDGVVPVAIVGSLYAFFADPEFPARALLFLS